MELDDKLREYERLRQYAQRLRSVQIALEYQLLEVAGDLLDTNQRMAVCEEQLVSMTHAVEIVDQFLNARQERVI